MFQLDAARGIRIDVTSRAPFIGCTFTPDGGPRRILLYEIKRPDAFWRYFAPARWLLLGQCNSARATTEMKLFDSSYAQAHAGSRVWLVTAWDSVSHKQWGQMERYAVSSIDGTDNYLFGRPRAGRSPPDLVTVSVSPGSPR